MLELIKETNAEGGGSVSVLSDGTPLGRVGFSKNPYHAGNVYIDFSKIELKPEVGGEVSRRLFGLFGRPLQVMTSSENTSLTRFLKACGFRLKRRCFTYSVTREDYLGFKTDIKLGSARAGEPVYDKCAELMYEKYVKDHEAVNPFTAGLRAFEAALPERVYYSADEGLSSFAFCEDGEIAYIFANGSERFKDFCAALVNLLFDKHKLIEFECDDCDDDMNKLASLFNIESEASYDTYIFFDY